MFDHMSSMTYNYLHHPCNNQFFPFEGTSLSALNSSLSYGGVADAYINEEFQLPTSATDPTARLRALEGNSPLITQGS